LRFNFTMRSLVLASLMIAAVLCQMGCHTATVTKPLALALYADDADAQMDFWHTLATRKLASNNEAFHGLLLYLDGKDPAENYQQRVQILKSRHLLAAKFNEPADVAVTRGTLSVPIIKTLKIKGGLMRLVLPDDERYATRELQYQGVYPVSSPNQLFSGTEFVGVIGKLDDYQHGVAKPVTNRLSE
jgi:hypothetical protein